jgi:hypothetical protein
MEKISKKRKFLEILWAFLISLTIELIVILTILNIVVVPTYIQKNNIIKEKCEENTFQKIEKIVSNVSNHSYKWNVYDCSEFSEELVRQLNNSGISAYCVSGIHKTSNLRYEGHTWVETIIDNQTYPIESTGGFFIDSETYKEKYKILKKGFCV